MKSSRTCNVLDVVCFSQRGLDSGRLFQIQKERKIISLSSKLVSTPTLSVVGSENTEDCALL